MQKTFLKKIEKVLKEDRVAIEKQLKTFATKDKIVKGDWDTKYPKLNGEVGGAMLEQAADQVEEYGNLLPIEYALEAKLKDINLALKKVKDGRYGVCEKCGKKISRQRLEAYPEARLCAKCIKDNRD